LLHGHAAGAHEWQHLCAVVDIGREVLTPVDGPLDEDPVGLDPRGHSHVVQRGSDSGVPPGGGLQAGNDPDPPPRLLGGFRMGEREAVTSEAAGVRQLQRRRSRASASIA
jgi:hypothetical protein